MLIANIANINLGFSSAFKASNIEALRTQRSRDAGQILIPGLGQFLQ
jgi:hypothetical protein